MARPIAPALRALLAAAHYNIHNRAEVQNADGTWIDVTGYFLGADWSEDLDNPVIGGTAQFLRDRGATSLAPLITNSVMNVDDAAAYAPLLESDRGIRFLSAATAPGAAPVPADWFLIFEGVVDDPDAASGDNVAVAFRDYGARLLDTIIEEERKYGSADGVAMQAVAQAIINDHADPIWPPFVLVVEGNPNWFLNEFTQKRGVSVLEAVRALALQIGWDVRYRIGATGAMDLTLYEPERGAAPVAFTLGPSEYIKVEKFATTAANVRNRVRVGYRDRVTNVRRWVVRENVPSIQKYGVRFMEINLADSDNIDSEVEAVAMAQAAVDDLAFPKALQRVRGFLFWPAQLGDKIEYLGNAVHYTDAQQLGTITVRQSITKSDGRTFLDARGDGAGAYADWLRRARRNPPEDEDGVPTPEFSQLFPEETGFGGTTGDGYCWMLAKFNAFVLFIRIWLEEGETKDTTPMPDVGDVSGAITLYRPEGQDGQNPDFETVIPFATRPGAGRVLRAAGYDARGRKSPDWTPDPVDAFDPLPTPMDGEIIGFSVLGALGTYSLTINVGDVETTEGMDANWLFIMQNRVVVRRIFLGGIGNVAKFYTAEGLNETTDYTFEVFVWNNGVSGVPWRWTNGIVSVPPETDPTPRFVLNSPRIVVDGGGVQSILAEYIVNDPGATFIELQFSFEGTSSSFGWLKAAGPGARSVLLDTTGFLTDADTGPKWYRLVTFSGALGNIVRKVGAPVFWPGVPVPPGGDGGPGGGSSIVPLFSFVVAIRGGSPIPMLVIAWTCANPDAAYVSIERSDDDGAADPYAPVPGSESASVASGEFVVGAWSARAWFRMKAHRADGTVLATSPSDEYTPAQF